MTEQVTDSPPSDLGGGLSEVWTCGVRAWSEYLIGLSGARSIDDLMGVQTRLLTASCEVFGQAAGEMLQRHGLTTPTLNEP